jgi:hypothetical protein
MTLKDNEVLIEDSDHRYRIARVRTRKVTWNKRAKAYFEYAGDEHLDADEVAVESLVVE